MVSKESLLRKGLSDEVRRVVLKEAEERYRHELMGEEERLLVAERIRRLRRELGLRGCVS
jgi:hypothetical protein